MASNEPSEILDGLTHVYECDEQKVSGIIAPKDGIYRENLSVYVKDGNTELASGTTNSNGIFNISFFLPVGQYDPIIKCGNNTKSMNYYQKIYSGLRSLACSLTLTSDKDILSVADNDSATLSATLKCTETNEFLSNRNITFEITKDDTVIQTLVGQTNSSGVATVTYESQGLGDISITAHIGSISSETYTVEDCINYDAMTSNSGKWTIPSTCSTSYDSTGGKFGTATSYSQVKLTDKLTSACTVEFTLVDYYTSSSQGIGDRPLVIYQYTNGETTPSQEIMVGGEGNSFRACGTAYNRALSKNTVYKIEYGSSTIKVYEGNTQLGSVTNNVHLPTRFEFHIGKTSGRWIKIKDLKVKPL